MQEALAFEAGLRRTYISGIERGTRNPTIVILARLANCRMKRLSDGLPSPGHVIRCTQWKFLNMGSSLSQYRRASVFATQTCIHRVRYPVIKGAGLRIGLWRDLHDRPIEV